MSNTYDYKRYAVLYVDDEEMALKYFEKAFGNEFRILTATNGADGLKLIETHGDEIGILLTDQRMPGQKGVQILERTRQLRPKIVRMMITAFADFGVTVDAVNLGNVFRYISKPLQVEDMRNTLRRGMEFFLLQRERDELLREKLGVLQNMVITDRVISLGVLASSLYRNLRNPLEAVQTFLKLAPSKLSQENVDLNRLHNPDFWSEFHAQVIQQASRVSELIGELDSISSNPAVGSTAEPLNTQAVLQQALEAVRPRLEAKNIALKVQLDPDLPTLATDRQRFERLFTLLLEEELNLLPAGSNLSFTATAKRFADKPVTIQFEIKDDGPGLPNTALRSVFDPFVRDSGDAQNFGLGLMAVYLLVYHHGGHMEASNLPEKGAVYQIEIPVLAEHPTPIAESSRDFVSKVLVNDQLWERLLAGD